MTRTAICGLALAALFGCAGLIPKDLKYTVHMEPVLPEGRRDYFVDVEDSSFVFSKEGVLVKVRHMTDDELDRRFPPLFDGRHVNPYTHNMKDPETGYIPPRFTVFEVTVVNLTYAKVEFDPAKAVLLTDTGEEHKYYDPGRQGAGPLGGNTFAKYYKTELGISGNEKEIALERMGIVYKTIYHRERPVLQGRSTVRNARLRSFAQGEQGDRPHYLGLRAVVRCERQSRKHRRHQVRDGR